MSGRLFLVFLDECAWFTSENACSCVIINEFMYYLCTGNERLRPRNALLMSDNAFSLKIMYEFIYLMCKATCEIYRQFSKLARTQGKSSKIIRKLCFFVKRRKGYQTIQLGGGRIRLGDHTIVVDNPSGRIVYIYISRRVAFSPLHIERVFLLHIEMMYTLYCEKIVSLLSGWVAPAPWWEMVPPLCI